MASLVRLAAWVGVVLFCPLLYHAQWPPAIFNDERSMKYGTNAQKEEIKYETQITACVFRIKDTMIPWH